MFHRHHTIPDLDRGVIPDNPANLNPSKIPKNTTATNPFLFGGANHRMYARIPTGQRRYYTGDTFEPQISGGKATKETRGYKARALVGGKVFKTRKEVKHEFHHPKEFLQ